MMLRARPHAGRRILTHVASFVAGVLLTFSVLSEIVVYRRRSSVDVRWTGLAVDDNTGDVQPVVENDAVSASDVTEIPPASREFSSDSSTRCTYSWMAYADRHVPGGLYRPAASVADCQSACVNDTNCVGADFDADRHCYVILSTDGSGVRSVDANMTEKIGCVHYDLHRICDTDVDDDSVAEHLHRTVRVLCWVMTSPENHKSKAVHIQATWGRRCNLLFFATEQDDLAALPVIKVDVAPGREHLTSKSLQTFDYLYRHHLNDADWFLKADDDTFIVLENLRYFLSSKDTRKPVYFGQPFKLKAFINQGYMSGGAGYVLSREALTRLATRTGDIVECREKYGVEDLEIGKCLERFGVELGDTLDSRGRERFLCVPPESVINGDFMPWYPKYVVYEMKKGIGAVSDYVISFHGFKPSDIYTMEFFTYHLRAYGIRSRPPQLGRETAATTRGTDDVA